MAERAPYSALIEPVARRLLGEPNRALSRPGELRYGSNGSLAIDLEKGVFADHERGTGGGVVDLVVRERGGTKAEAAQWLQSEGLVEATPATRSVPSTSIFYDYRDPDGTTVYRVERRGKGSNPPFLQHGPDGRGGFRSGRGCMQGVPRLPYRLPELLAADPGEPIVVVEGEKDADCLASLGFVSTTNSGGAGKFGQDLAAYFVGRRVVIIPDNDPPGEAHAADVAEKLSSVAASVSTLRLNDLPPKGDVSDAIDRGLAPSGLRIAIRDALAQPQIRDRLPVIDPASWAGEEIPPRRWALEGWIPTLHATLLTGPGGAGKSLASQLLSTCIAAGSPFMGIAVARAIALYLTAEDDAAELHRRQVAICAGLGLSLSALSGRLHLVSLAGATGNELAVFAPDGRMSTTPAWQRLRTTVLALQAKFLVLDNVAHLFAGNENVRHEVASFVGLLNGLAQEAGASILFIGHPAKNGAEFSGSTAWENQVRSRLFLEIPHEEGGVVDRDRRALSKGKSNYAQSGDRLSFRWHAGTFVRDEDLPTDTAAQLTANAEAVHDNAAFLRCLAERTKQRRPVSERASRTFAPFIFATMPEAKHVSKARLEAAMDRLFRLGRIERGFLWRDTAEGRDIHGLRLARLIHRAGIGGLAIVA